MVYLDFTEENDKVWRIQTSHLKLGWGYLLLRKIYVSAVYDYLCSYIYNINQFKMLQNFTWFVYLLRFFRWVGGNGHMLEDI